MGLDCAGAVQVCPAAEVDTVLSRGGSYEALSEADVARRLTAIRQRTHLARDVFVPGYFSLAGAQAKIALHRQQGGPSQARIVGLLRRHSTSPADDIADLIDALAYSWVIGAPTVTPRTSACCSTTSATAQTPASPTCAEKVVRQAESGRIRRFAQGKMSCVPQRSHSTWRSPGRCSSPNENVARPSFAHRISYSPRAPCSLLTSPSRNHGLSPASIACRSDMNSASAAVN